MKVEATAEATAEATTEADGPRRHAGAFEGQTGASLDPQTGAVNPGVSCHCCSRSTMAPHRVLPWPRWSHLKLGKGPGHGGYMPTELTSKSVGCSTRDA
jgi:hypothetical protein